MQINVFCDSSYDEKNKVAGIGITIQNGFKQRAISTWIPCKSNNYAEMWAIYQSAILSAGHDAIIYTDSQSALAYIEGKIKEKPRSHEQYILHQQMKVLAYKINKLHPCVKPVKAHSHLLINKEIGNAMADVLARSGRVKFYAR